MSSYMRYFKPNLITLVLFPFCVSAASPWVVNNGTALQVTADYSAADKYDYPLVASGAGSQLIANPGLSFDASTDGTYVAYIKDHARLELHDNILAAREGILLQASELSMMNGSIQTSASNAYAIDASDQADIKISGTQIYLQGEMNRGISMSGGALTANDIRISSAMLRASGVNLYGAEAQLSDVTIDLEHSHASSSLSLENSIFLGTNLNIHSGAESSAAIWLKNSTALNSMTLTDSMVDATFGAFLLQGGELHLNNVGIHTTLKAGYGIDINAGSTVVMRDGSIRTEGEMADAVWLAQGDTHLDADGTTFRTEGRKSAAVNAQHGTATISNSYLRTYGEESRGLYSGNRVEGDHLVITTAGTRAYGAVAAVQGVMKLNASSISTSGKDAVGIFAMPAGIVQADGVAVTTRGEGAYALATVLGNLDIRNSTATTTGNADGLYANGSNATQSSIVQLDNVSLTSVQGTGIVAQGASPLNIQLKNGTTVTGGNGQAVRAMADASIQTFSLVNLSASDDVTLLGDVVTDNPNNQITLSLVRHSLLQGATQNVTQLDLDASSNWVMTGDSSLTTLNNSGMITFNRDGAFKTLHVKGDLSGSGAFSMNVHLGDNHSPADRLKVAGKAAGTFGVTFHQNGGQGAVAKEGIPVINVAGDSEGAEFKQNNVLVAGNYEYFLNKVGEHDWYLQSHFEPVVPNIPVTGVDAEKEPVVSPPQRAYRPETAGYLMAAAMNAAYGFTSAGTYHQRSGAYQNDQAAWGRIYSRHDRYGAGRFGYEVNSSFMQLGGNLLDKPLSQGWHLNAGPMLTLGQQRSDNRDDARRARIGLSVHTGKTQTRAYGVGGYVTASHENGQYLDLVGQLTRYSNRFSSLTAMQQDSYGLVFSAEAGKPLTLFDRLKLEPQLQLMGQSLNVSQTEAGGVKLNDQNQFIGQARGGLRLFWDHDSVQPYLTLDYVRQLGKTPGIMMNGEVMRPDVRKNTGQAGAGISGKVSQNVSVYAQGQYAHSFGQGIEGYSGNLGLKYQF